VDTTGLSRSGRAGRICRELLAEGLVDLFASDNHGDARSLATARAWLADAATPEHVELLTRENARRLLDDQPTAPVPPLPREGTMLSMLRILLRPRR
jgi:protein-tyrosine phosphatase